MPIIAAVGDMCVGNNTSGFIISGSPTSKVLTFPIARVTDKVLIIGTSPLPPGGELVSIPVGFCPAPCVWFYIEEGTIIASPAKSIDITLPIACDGAQWVSPHFNGIIKAAVGAPNMVM
jgi:hypothetical protein